MSFRGRGRGPGGRGRFGTGLESRNCKKEPYILFPEDVTLPSLPSFDAMSNEEKLLIRSKYRLEHFWVTSCYHLEQEAFPKLDKSEGSREKNRKDQKSKVEDVEIERYSDRFKQRTLAKREDLESYLKQTPSNFPPELIKGTRRLQCDTKKLRWDSGEKRMETFAKLEEKLKGKDEDQSKKDESEDEPQEEGEEEEDSDDGDYTQNKDFDDDEDDINMDEEPEEDIYE